MARTLANAVLLVWTLALAAGCGPAPSAGAAPAATPRPQVTMPPPSAHPNYPPRDLADVAALAAQGLDRRLVGIEGQPIQACGSFAWVKVHELDGTPPRQIAADLMQMAVAHHVLVQSCGGYVFGTTNLAHCNCYEGDHGLLTVNRGVQREPAPGKMQIIFSVSDTETSPDDWELTVDAPAPA